MSPTYENEVAQLKDVDEQSSFKLSDDIMYTILEMAYLHDFPRCHLHSGKVQNSPVVVTHVCRRWRQLALDLSALWSCIHITPEQGAKYPNALTTFLERSGDRSLSITFNFMLADHELHNHYPRYLSSLKRLLAHNERWQNCGFYFKHDHQLQSVYHILQGADFPSMQFLQVMMYCHVDTDMRSFPLQITTPKLHEFRGSVVHTFSPSIYAALTDLTLDNYSLPPFHLISILNGLSSTLEKLVLRLFSFGDDWDSVPATYEPLQPLPRLRHLTLAEPIPDDELPIRVYRQLLTHCPNLETFHGVDLTALGYIVTPTLPIRFHHIRSLIVDGDLSPLGEEDASKSCWIALTNIFRPAQDVYIRDSFATKYLAASQDETITRGPISLPDLQTLTVKVRVEADLDTVLTFAKHRVNIGHPLTSITLLCSDEQRHQFGGHWETEIRDVVLVTWKSYRDPSYLPFDPWDDTNNAPTLKPWRNLQDFEDQDL